jgi:NitT/TauT family transport system substrate-binding protein
VDTIRERPQLVAGMGRAMAKSTMACAAAPQACARAFWRFDPTSKPTPDKEAEWVKGTVAVLQANHSAIQYALQRNPNYGAFDPAVVDTYVKVLEQGGTLPAGATVKADDILTNQFVPEFNRFDPLVVQGKAH